jgi:N-acyl-D-amino-acid deacylase
VRSMTTLAADTIGRPALGRITPGTPADLVLFDHDTIIDRATYEEPRIPPLGIARVIVAGRTLVVDGEITEAAAAPAGHE